MPLSNYLTTKPQWIALSNIIVNEALDQGSYTVTVLLKIQTHTVHYKVCTLTIGNCVPKLLDDSGQVEQNTTLFDRIIFKKNEQTINFEKKIWKLLCILCILPYVKTFYLNLRHTWQPINWRSIFDRFPTVEFGWEIGSVHDIGTVQFPTWCCLDWLDPL